MMTTMTSEDRPESLSLSDKLQYDSFVRDDLEFRTITTFLNALECHEKVRLQNFEVVPKLKPYLKILSALSSLLVRGHEIVAILPKRSQHGVALLIGSDTSPFSPDDFPSPPSSPSSPPGRLNHYVTRNPRIGDGFGGIGITTPSVVTVGLDVDAFIMNNWNQSFEHHVQAFSDLLNAAFEDPGPKTANALKRYSTFQSALKINRRLSKSAVLRGLQKMDVANHTTQTLTPGERNAISVAMYRDAEGQRVHKKLYGYLTNWADQLTPPSLPLFHEFFTWLLSKLAGELKELCQLQAKKEPPVKFPVVQVKSVMIHLGMLRYLAWESVFFAQYIETVCPSRQGQKVSSGNEIDIASPLLGEPEEEDTGSDIGTEFETGEDHQTDSNFQPQPVSHPWILELRLITSNIHQLQHLLGRLPMRGPLSFSVQMIEYGRSGQHLKPWRELLDELFPNGEERNSVLRELEKLSRTRDTKFKFFRPDGPNVPALVFLGEVHCEAVLGCLYTLARIKRAEDIRWANIPRSVLRAAENSYSLLAPSKRCCPVCAKIISYLQPENGPPLQALGKHSIVFPCALPIGLPREVRTLLLTTYRANLKNRLRVLGKRSESSDTSAPAQSQPLLDHGKHEEQSPHSKNKEIALLILGDWEDMSIEELPGEWEQLKMNLSPGVADTCWWYMKDEYKAVLTPP